MESWVQEVLLPIVLAMLASNGLWALIGKQREKNNWNGRCWWFWTTFHNTSVW